jgi:hypothetical protein
VLPLEMRICTKSRTSNEALDTSVPSSASYPPALMLRVLGSMLVMLFTRKQKNPI